jgi:hypothetical protein
MILWEQPKYVGGYEIGGPNALLIKMKHKPFWLHRKMAKWFFGFVWKDEA